MNTCHLAFAEPQQTFIILQGLRTPLKQLDWTRADETLEVMKRLEREMDCTCEPCPSCGPRLAAWAERGGPQPPFSCGCYAAGRESVLNALKRDEQIGPLIKNQLHRRESGIHGSGT